MKIFITGASGYIGGSLSEHLRDLGHEVTGLVRSQDKADALGQRGISSIIGELSDIAALTLGARSADAVINTAEADDVELVKPLVDILSGTGKALIHTSGSSIVVDNAKGLYASETIYSDDTPFVPMEHRIPRVTVDRLVRSAGITGGIRAAVICPSMVYGQGLSLKRDSHQIPLLMEKSRERGAGLYIGNGSPIWSGIFLGDLVTLYALAIEKAPAGAFFFAESQETSFADIASAISESLGFGGRTESWSLDQAVAEVGGVAQVALATNCRVRALNARRLLGWTPVGPNLRDALLSHA